MTQELPPFNDELRSGIIGLIGKVNPEGVPIGSAVAFIVGMFWPEADTSEATWRSVKKYAEELVKEAIDTERVDQLSGRLEGLKTVARHYAETSYDSEQKMSRLVSLLTALDTFEKDFWNERAPEQMFPLFTAFGSLNIAALAEQAFSYAKIGPNPRPDPDAKGHTKDFADAVTKYTDAAQAMFDRLCTWRFGLVQVSEVTDHGLLINTSIWTARDLYGGGDGYLDSGTDGGGEAWAETVAADRAEWIQGDFVEKLQSLLAVARLWKYIDPRVPRPVPEYQITNERPWGGGKVYGTPFADTPPSLSSRITKIHVRHGSGVVQCLEVFYDGVSQGAHGDPGGGELAELELADDEYVVAVSGRRGDHLDAIQFTTNKQRTVGGGGSGGEPYAANGHDWQQTSLFSVDGRNDDRRLTGLSLHWKHLSPMGAYVRAYKRDPKPIVPSTDIHLRARGADAPDPTFVAAFDTQYSGRAASNEYFPRHGTSPVRLQLRLRNGEQLSNKDAVQIWTTESGVGEYACLGKYRSDDAYYYYTDSSTSEGWGDRRQLWYLIKVIPSDGPVLLGEQVYLRNLDNMWHLCLDARGYLGTSSEPYPWEVQPA